MAGITLPSEHRVQFGGVQEELMSRIREKKQEKNLYKDSLPVRCLGCKKIILLARFDNKDI